MDHLLTCHRHHYNIRLRGTGADLATDALRLLLAVKLGFSDDQTSRDHVVQRLPSLGETANDVAYGEGEA